MNGEHIKQSGRRKAVGLTGKDGGLSQARKLKMTKKYREEAGETEIIDIGLVGEVTEVRPGALDALDKGCQQVHIINDNQ